MTIFGAAPEAQSSPREEPLAGRAEPRMQLQSQAPSFQWRCARAVAAAASGATGLWLALQCVMWGFIHTDGAHRENIALAAAADASTTLASVVAEHVARSVNAADATLRLARVAIRSGAPVSDHIAKPTTRSDVIHRLAHLDAVGRVLDATPAQSDPFAKPGAHMHVQAHKAAARDMLFIGGPALVQPAGRRTISFSRSLRSENDVFEGAVLGSVDVDLFMQPHHEASLRTGAVALLSPDGTILARVGRHDLADTLVRGEASEATCLRRSPARSLQDALVCARRVDGLVVVVAATMSSVLRPVRRHQRHLSLGAALITLFSLPLLATSILRRFRLFAAEDALERAQRRASSAARDLRYALDNMSHGLMLLDIRGAIVLSNNRAHRLLGFGPGDAPPLHNEDLIRRLVSTGDGTPCLCDALRLDPAPSRVVCPGPGARFLDVRTSRLPDGGFVRTLENATRRHHDSLALASARDAAETASRARGYFLARMSHEIRTPLHAVMGFTRLMHERPLDAGTAALLAQVSAASGHLIAVVDDVLDLSLVDAGHLRLQEAPFHLWDVLRRLEPIAAMAGEGKDIKFRWSVDAQVPEWLLGDERRLFQILVNLVGNAHKFTERGEVVLEASLVEFSEGPRLRIDVRDTGRGVDLATVTRLFETFARGPGTESTPGAGLGLAIVKQLVDMMDGDLEVGCGARGGSSFAFVVPLRQTDPPPAPIPSPSASALHVLLADDTPSSRMLAQAMLEARGHRVVAVADGAEALGAWRSARFDLVLLDLQMPNMGGLEAAAFMREEESDDAHVFIAALTAQARPDDAHEIGAAGMDCVLRKPFSPLQFDQLLARAAKARPGAAQAPNEV